MTTGEPEHCPVCGATGPQPGSQCTIVADPDPGEWEEQNCLALILWYQGFADRKDTP